MNKGGAVLLTLMILSTFAISLDIVSAQEEVSELGTPEATDETPDVANVEDNVDAGRTEIEHDFDENVELQTDGGITPDSALYFVDEIFDNFGKQCYYIKIST